MLDYNVEWLHAVQTGLWQLLVLYKEMLFKDNEKVE